MAEKRPDRVRGPEHDTFWAWCAKGELRLQHCAACAQHTWPAAPSCEHCGSEALTWSVMSGRGVIVSWCAFERDYYAGVFPLPWNTILVELAEGPLMIANPIGLTYDDLSAGLPVQVDFIECEDSAGTFKLPVFKAV